MAEKPTGVSRGMGIDIGAQYIVQGRWYCFYPLVTTDAELSHACAAQLAEYARLTPKRMAEIRRVEASRADLHYGHRRPSRMLRLTGRDD